jgi:hypothetical protein
MSESNRSLVILELLLLVLIGPALLALLIRWLA